MKTGLEGRVVLVTGGASGIGRASCLAFACERARVVAADVAVEGGEETASMARQAGGEAIFVRADVSKASDVDALMANIMEKYGRLDCAHNNAGIAGPMARTADCSEQDWDDVIRVNLKGVWLCMRREIAEMAKQRSGVIVNTASTAGLRGTRFACAYAAGSHGVVGLTKSAALEYAMDGIRINAVCPGIVDTPMIRRHIGGDAKREAQFKAASPVGRMAAPGEIAQAVVWLCSDAASYLTGHALVLDGGRTAQ
jgi:NAD(P)-dependent dehydrogenase (short-subunit alcohol dehydrogenase family)